MKMKVAAFLLSVALLAGALGTAANAGGTTVMWQNRRLTVTERLQPLTITFKNRITRPIRFSCRFLQDTEWRRVRGRLGPRARMVTQPADGLTASQFSCHTKLAG